VGKCIKSSTSTASAVCPVGKEKLKGLFIN
jgi:hypothetical protein